MAYTTLDDFLQRAHTQLVTPGETNGLAETGDMAFSGAEREGLRAAAVLIPVIPRRTGASVLLTVRPDTMATHAGQVAFPGGKVDAGDTDAVAAALREAEEEVGVDPGGVELVGCGAPYLTGTRFRITPVLGVLPPEFIPRPDPTEVEDVFETPLDYLMRAANHRPRKTFYKGRERRYYEMPHNGYRIWGVTAGIIRELYLRLYESGQTME